MKQRPSESPPTPKYRLDLQLLEHRVQLEGEGGRFFRDLARCFDASPGGDETVCCQQTDLRIRLIPAVAGAGSRDQLRVMSDPPEVLERCGSLGADQASILASALNLWAAIHSRRHYVFHAGCVERAGRGILIPGPSHCGKSTLTAGLLQRGFALLSDEIGAIEVESGRLARYRRALWLRPQSLRVLGLDDSLGASLRGADSRVVSPAEMGAKWTARSPVPVLVVCPQFQQRAATRIERIRPGPAVIALMESSCSQARFKVAGLDLIIDLARRLPCYRLVFSDLGEAVAEVENAFRQARVDRP